MPSSHATHLRAETPEAVVRETRIRRRRRRAHLSWLRFHLRPGTRRAVSLIDHGAIAERRGLPQGSLAPLAAPGFPAAARKPHRRLEDAIALDDDQTRAVELEDHRDVLLRVVEQSPLADRARALVVAGEREPDVSAQLVELPAQVAHARTDIPSYVLRRRCGKAGVDPLPGLGKELHDADRAGARDHVLLEDGFHPCERAGELGSTPARRPSGRWRRDHVAGRPGAGRRPGARPAGVPTAGRGRSSTSATCRSPASRHGLTW